ncbi:hypothetical protein MJ585_01620 [Klebsiella pneumoniae]|nr:hypothetical protein MJ585_01620 [Klebsiella pneumoniae]
MMIGYATTWRMPFPHGSRAKADEGVEQSLWFTVYAGEALLLSAAMPESWNLARKERLAR